MNHLAAFILFSILFQSLQAQNKEYKNCEITYFKNKAQSTSKCYDEYNRWGVAKAFNTKGEVIFERGLRKVGGHSSVYFSFYPSGAVHIAECSDAPDGGIQWFKSKTTFDENGKIIDYWEQSNDDMRRPSVIINPNRDEKPLQPQNPPPAPKPEPKPIQTPQPVIPPSPTLKPNECAVPITSQLWLVNKTPVKIKVLIWPENPKDSERTVEIDKEQSVMVGFLNADKGFEDPYSKYTLKVSAADPKVRRIYKITKHNPYTVHESRDTKKYYYRVD